MTNMNDRPLPMGTDDFRAYTGDHERRSVSKRHKKNMTISDEAYAGLRFIASRHHATFGNKVSVSELLERIGNFELKVMDPTEEAKRLIIERLKGSHGE